MRTLITQELGFLLILLSLISVETTSVTEISPKVGSLNGGTRITIFGSGFAADQFNFNSNTEKGNEVKLVDESGTQTYPCNMHTDGSTSSQVTCYTNKMPQGKYYVRVKVDGEDIPEASHCATDLTKCQFQAHPWYTPTIEGITPRSGPPGSFINVSGKIISTRYGSNLDESPNGVAEKFLRSYAAGQYCEVKNLDTDEFYDFALENDDSKYGHYVCKMKGTYVGNINVSFIIEGKYGRSNPDLGILTFSGNNKIQMFQTYAVINSVSPSSGSIKGGTKLTITGDYFDETDSPARVMVGGVACENVVVTSGVQTEITCDVPEQPAGAGSAFTGNRGMLYESWTSTSKSFSTIDDILVLTSSAADYNSSFIDEAYFTDSSNQSHVTRMTGFFIPSITGDYRFYIKCDDYAVLYFSSVNLDPSAQTKVATCAQYTTSYYDSADQRSQKMTLTAGHAYYLTILHGENLHGAFVRVGVRMDTSPVPGDSTGAAVQEKQAISVQSDKVQEVQTLTFTGFDATASAYTAEKQKVTVSNIGGNEQVTYRLKVLGATTGPIKAISDGPSVQAALNRIPMFSPDKVSVTESSTATSTEFTISFDLPIGNLAQMEAIVDQSGTSLQVTVTDDTDGVTGPSSIYLEMDGVVSPPITPGALDSDVKSSLEQMFGVRCPSTFTSSDNKYFQDFENPSSVSAMGEALSDIQPFCGRYSIKNPTYIYRAADGKRGITLSQHPWLCFAFNGPIDPKVRVEYKYSDSGEAKEGATTLSIIATPTAQKWNYVCTDILSGLMSAKSGGSSFEARKITLYKDTTSVEDLYIDTVIVTREDLATDEQDGILGQRMLSAMPGGYPMESVTVTKSGDVYTVSMTPHNCSSGVPLFTLALSQTSVSDLVTSNTVTSTAKQGVSLTTSRTTAASPRVTGTVDVTFEGNTVTIPAEATEQEVQDLMSTIPNIGAVSVTRDGDCANFEWAITWLTRTGDLPDMTVDGSNLGGVNTQATVTTKRNGGLWYDPLPGDMLRTHETTPHVDVYINDIPSRCTGTCSYEWKVSDTPTVTSVSPTSGSPGASVTIDGTGFSSTPSDNSVTIGNAACTVTTATANQISCTLGDGSGTHDVVVNVSPKGLASGTASFTYTSGVATVTPSQGGDSGGTRLTVTGTGFAPDATVTVGTGDCEIVSQTSSEIVCLTAASAAGVVDVSVNQFGTQLTKSSAFTYDASLTASISSISLTTASVKGGETLTVTGSGFGSQTSDSELKVGGETATITSYSATQVEATVPSQSPGTYTVKFTPSNSGYARYTGSGSLEITYKLKVTRIYPTSGSLYGGTVVTVTGEGFGTDASALSASVGTHDCEVIGTVTDTEFTCQIAETGKIHKVTNQGYAAVHGVGYAWDPSIVNAQVGDTIKWEWWTSDLLKGKVTYGVFQTDDATSTTSNGFSSGVTKVSSGTYSYQVTSPGDLFYWSGYVDSGNSISLRGVVKVTERAQSVEDFSLTLSGIEAEYDTTSASSPSSTGCEVVSPLSGCTTAPATGGTTGKHHFSFETCLSGSVTSISHNQGHSQKDIVFTGTGFTDNTCKGSNQITAGGYICVVSASSTTSATCKFDASAANPMPIGVMNTFKVYIKNRGYSILAISDDMKRTFVLEPHISTYSPENGALAGGFTMTIQGGGFTDDTMVMIGSDKCEIDSSTPVTYDTIVCSAPSNNKAQALDIIVTNNGNNMQASCSDSTLSCTIGYSVLSSPTVTAVTPTSITGASNAIQITGTQFGTDSSKVKVTIGGESCSVSSVTATTIDCTVGRVPVGNQAVVVTVDPMGKATSSGVTVTSEATLISVTPNSGSTNGGTIIGITGNGFVVNKTSVTVGGNPCEVGTVTLSSVECTVPAGSGAAVVEVTSNTITYPTLTFTYDSSVTPTVTSVTPSQGKTGDSITIAGTGFSNTASDVRVTMGDTPCSVTSSSTTQIQCTLGASAASAVDVKVTVSPHGSSGSGTTFTYALGLTSVTPITGSTAGGQLVTVTGSGFSDTDTVVSICGQSCEISTSAAQSETQLICKSPQGSAGACDVVVTQGGQTQTLAAAYTYDAGLTPQITGVSPKHGGTGGGTTLTITGSGFGTTVGVVTVTIGGVACSVQTVQDTQVVCQTGQRSAGSIDAQVELEVGSNGIADQVSADFSYYNVWSSAYSWGTAGKPEAGHLVVIPAGMTILLDETTPVLEMILIQGGRVIFDDKDIELHANYILITDGGSLQVGTEAEPFQHNAVIEMHGMFRSQELPIYGSKVLALRNGTLDLHGKPTPITWTTLAATANAGDTTLTLEDAVNWDVGSQITIPSTGHRHSQSQNEVRRVTAVSANGKTLTLDSPLTYSHVSITETYGTKTVTMAGEVGLLSHNVVFRGNRDPQWNDTIPACEAGFDTGEFTTQTCFQGRFGEEMGSDQFGGHILIHSPVPNIEAVIARISYVEFTHVGQAFRLGRYPLHFHLLGNSPSSYAKGCAFHHTYNRAVNVHATHNLTVEHNVLYDVMGGAFFLEDGVETGNTFQYNLGTFVRASSSLLNDDITPATFWVTNPNNIVQHNHAAGGTHFGFWYRMHAHPDGPSFDPNICPQNVPLGVFRNNSAHSFGWFGLWIFQEYHPRKDGSCSLSDPYETAYFHSLTAWNCEKGAEGVNVGPAQFRDMIYIHNEKAGYEGKLVKDSPQFDEDLSYAVRDTIIVARSPGLAADPGSKSTDCTRGGIVLPYGNGMVVSNVEFYNFDQTNCNAFTFTKIDGTCTFLCGGFTYHFKGITYNNSPNRGKFDWKWQAVIIDLDGTSTGSVGHSITTTTSNLPTGKCVDNTAFNAGGLSTGVSVCDPTVKFHRLALKDPIPKTLEAKNLTLTNQYGADAAFYAEKRITHKPGWMGLLVDGEKYDFTWENAERVTNISYHATYYTFDDPTHHVEVCQKMSRAPDRFFFDGTNSKNISLSALDSTVNKNGDWYFDNSTMSLCYLVSGRTSRRKRGSGAMPVYEVDRDAHMEAYKCYYTDCIPPPDPDTIPPTCTRASNATLWSDANTWTFAEAGWGGNYGGGSYGPPREGDKVKIPAGHWIILDQAIPSFDQLIIEGTLELDHGPSKDREFVLNVTYLYIYGGRLIIGCDENSRFEGKATIALRGDHSTPDFPVTEGPAVGSKVIGVFGGLDLHGKDVGITWTTIQSTATAGSSSITLSDQVTWSAGDEIVITSTGYSAWEVEVFTIASIAPDQVTVTLNSTLQYTHIAHTETLPSSGKVITMAAEVGLLTRNIKVIGDYYDNMYKESYGARVLVGVTSNAVRSYTGYARLSNVEFYRGAQLGFDSTYDPRHTVSFLDIPDTTVKPRYIKQCSFHNNFGRAIGVFGTDNLEVQDNVIYSSVGPAIHTTSSGTKLRRNLISLMIWPGAYQDRYEAMNFDYWGLIEAVKAEGTVLDGNHLSSSERVAYHGHLESCTPDEPWTENVFHSNLVGAGLYSEDEVKPLTCSRYSNITAWKNYDFGIYYHDGKSLTVTKFTSIDNGIGLFPFVIGPNPVSHVYEDQFVEVTDSTFVGTSAAFDCEKDVADPTDDNFVLSGQGRGWRIEGKGRSGVVTATFSAGGNGSPFKPHTNIMAYNTIAGRMDIKNTVFANFQTGTGKYCGRDVMISTNPKNDDALHPVRTSGLTLESSVDQDNKIHFHRPNVGKVNPSDCVDMDCDGLKKIMIVDNDGTLLGGSHGVVLPQSEYEWDGDPRRGLGDYRIPKAMLTDTAGNRIDVEVLAKYKGVIRDSTCTYQSTWQAYQCNDYSYKMLMIESMDPDTETSRLSPVALLGWNDNGDGYLDLMNGPQDHGWCAGYTCQKRVSIFPALVALGRNYTMYFTRNAPQSLRYLMLNAQKSDGVTVGSYHAKPNRLDVFLDGQYIVPENGVLDGDDNLQLSQPTFPGQYFPDASTASCGANYMDRDIDVLYIKVCGDSEVVIQTSPQIVIGFNVPTMTVDQFFGPNLVNNLAMLLGISSDKIRVMDTVSGVDRRRRKRSTGTGPNTIFYIEIGNKPCSTANCSTAVSQLSYSDQQTIAVQLINEYQTGNLSDILNITINGVSVAEALPPATDPTWATIVNQTDYTKVLLIPDTMVMDTHPVPGHEGNAFTTQPKLKILDTAGDHVAVLGATAAPWEVQVTLRSGTGNNIAATLIGNTTTTFVDGWANFTDLGISHAGAGYVLDFEIIYPTSANFTIPSQTLTVIQRPLKSGIAMVSAMVYQGGAHEIQLDIRDETTDVTLSDIAWSGLNWYANVSMVTGTTYQGSFTGTPTVVFNPVTGRATFSDITMNMVGMAHFKFSVYSVPAQYSFDITKEVVLLSSEYQNVNEDTTKSLSLKFDADYSSYGNSEFGAMVVNHFQPLYPYTRFSDISVSQGSVVVTVTVNGNTTTVSELITGFCDSITSGTTFTYQGTTFTMSTYLTVDGSKYYGISCGDEVDDKDDDEGTKAALIAALVVILVLVVALIAIGALVWRLKIYPKTKTHRSRDDVRYLGKGAFFFEDSFYRQDTFNSIGREKSFLEDNQKAPITTTFSEKAKNTSFSSHF